MHNERNINCIDLVVTEVQHFSPTLFLMELGVKGGEGNVPACRPGNFLEILIPNTDGVFLRRPLSIYFATEKRIGLLINKVGKGTTALAHAQVGDIYNVIVPLGNHFSDPTGDAPLLIGGGVGLAPMLCLGQYLHAKGIQPTYILGGRNKTAFPDLKLFTESGGRLFQTTDDGSLGHKGFVTNHPILDEEQFTDVYACGPTVMMKAVAAWAKKVDINCEVSLENLMACGMGVCLCCVEPTVNGHKAVCTEGPVFNVKELLW